MRAFVYFVCVIHLPGNVKGELMALNHQAIGGAHTIAKCHMMNRQYTQKPACRRGWRCMKQLRE